MIIEVGPGSGGYNFNPYAEPGPGAVCVDIDPPNSDAGDALWAAAYARCLPFRDGVAGRVYAAHVVERPEGPALFLRECYRALKRGRCGYDCNPQFHVR